MVMAMTAFSIIVCVFVLDLHHRNSNTAVPSWVRCLLLGRLSRCLGFPVRHCELGNSQIGTGIDGECTYDGYQRRGRSTAGHRAKGNRRLRTGQDISMPRCRPVNLERRARRQNSVLTDNGCVVAGAAATRRAVDVGIVRMTESTDYHRRGVESHVDVPASSEDLVDDTARLLFAILTQLRYITSDMRRHGKRSEVKDEWKLVAKVTDSWRSSSRTDSVVVVSGLKNQA